MIRAIINDIRHLSAPEELAAGGAILAFAAMIVVWGLAIK